MVQLSTSGRVVTAVATSAGNIGYFHAGETVVTAATNSTSNTPALSATQLNFATAMNGILWFVDGVHYVQFDPATGIATDWTASAGSLPIDANSNIPRLIETWRGRVVLSGLVGDPYNWFMSRVGDAHDYDYAPLSPGPADAVAGSASPQGKLGDMVTGFVPYTDDVAFLGCSHSLYLFNGDPQAGGQIDLVSDSIGMAWGRAWAKDPYGTLYFFSNRCGVYAVTPGSQPQRISQQIDNLLTNINSGANTVSMCWDDRQQAVHVFISNTTASVATTHFVYEWRSGSWFKDTFSNPNHNPLCVCQFDGNNPEDRVVLLGSWDGVARYLDPNAQNDDGRIIIGSVLLGPILSPTTDEMLLTELQATLGSDSGSITYEVLVGTTAEQALASTAVATGTFSGGRNPTSMIRRAGHVVYIKLSSTVPWRMESVRAIIRTSGRIRARSRF